MLDKSILPGANRQIAFNWERVKKRTEKKIHELMCNAPKVSRREELEAIRKQTTRLVECFNAGEATNTTDTRMDPTMTYDADGNTIQSSTSNSNPPPGTNDTIPIGHGPNVKAMLDITDRPMTQQGTTHPSLLALAPPQGREVNLGREEERGELGPDQNAIALLKLVQKKEVKGSDLQQDERRLVVRSLRMAGQTQDAIAELLGVSRRTIVSDCKYLRQLAAMEIQNTDTAEIAGEVYEVAKTAIRKALAAGHYKTVSTVMRDMVELLQSMGLVYRAPKTQMNANLNASLTGSRNGYQKYIETIGEDKSKVVEVLDCMFSAIESNDI